MKMKKTTLLRMAKAFTEYATKNEVGQSLGFFAFKHGCDKQLMVARFDELAPKYPTEATTALICAQQCIKEATA